MLCITFLTNTTEVLCREVLENYWHRRKDALSFCNNAMDTSLAQLPKFPLVFSDLKEVASMLAYICSLDNDLNVHTFQMGVLFKLRKYKKYFLYEFAEDIFPRNSGATSQFPDTLQIQVHFFYVSYVPASKQGVFQ